MSSSLAEAEALASRLQALLARYVRRSVVAGSIRRRRPEVGDIELVAEPRPSEGDLFGRTLPPVPPPSEESLHRRLLTSVSVEVPPYLNPRPEDLARRAAAAERKQRLQEGITDIHESAALWGRATKRGPRYVRVEGVLSSSLAMDLFLVHPPAEWGVILAIRTGPADFSRHLVSSLRKAGRFCVDGRVLDGRGRVIPCPTEEAFFEACGVPFLEPKDRGVTRPMAPPGGGALSSTL